MSKRGENIYKRKDNRWEGRYIREYDANGKIRYGYIYAKTYREVKRKLAEAKIANTKPKTADTKSLSYYCDEWLILSRNHVKESTYVKYRTIIEKHIKPMLGAYLPQNLNTFVIENFSYELLKGEKKLSSKTVKDILTILHSILKHIRKQDPEALPEIEIIYPKEQIKEMRILSFEEQNCFIQYLLKDMDSVKFGILLALLTGLRIGEICALRWGDVSLEGQTVSVEFTMQRLQRLDEESLSKTKILIGDAKTGHSKRVIPLNNYTLSLCKKMYVADPEAYVLTGRADKFFEPRLLQYRLKKYTKECQLKDVHFHVLRHTFATRCVEVGFETKSLSEILVHTSIKITLDRYVHPSMELKRSNMEKLVFDFEPSK